MTKRPMPTEEIADAIRAITRILHGRPAADVERILGVLLLAAAVQGVIDIDDLCTGAKGLLKEAKRDWAKVLDPDTLDG